MARTYFPPKCKYKIVDNHIETDGSVKNKVSGTQMGALLNCSPFSTPFQVACALLGLGREDISGKPAVNTGKLLETPIIRYADKTWGKKLGMFVPAEEIFDKRAGDHDAWVSDFKDDYFAGHVDGIVMANDGEYILEIKTSSNLDSWTEGVPDHYFWQVALYNHFVCKKSKAYVVLGMVNEFTHRDPYGFVPCENNVSIFELNIDDALVDQKMAEIREWYDKYVAKGITPDYNPEDAGDAELYEHLCMLTRDVEDIRRDIDRLAVLESEIAEYEATKIDLYTERDLLKGTLKQYLIANRLANVDSTDGEYKAVIGEQTRTKLDEAAMIADGINPDKYRVSSTNKTFSIKKYKKK